jgi:DNA polymerase-1
MPENTPFELITKNNYSSLEGKIYESLNSTSAIGLDTETTGLDSLSSKVRLLQLSTGKKTWVFDLFDLGFTSADPQIPNELPEKLIEVLENPKIVKVAQNAKFDWSMLFANFKVSVFPLFDTWIASKLLDPNIKGHSLKDLALRYLDIDLDKAEQNSNWTGSLTSEQLKYAALDASIMIPLRDILRERLIHEGIERCAKIEFQCTPAIGAMEVGGVSLLKDKWIEVLRSVESERNVYLEKVRPYFPATQPGLFSDVKEETNYNSPTSIKAALKQVTGKDYFDVTEGVLKPMAEEIPFVDWLLKYRHLEKITTSYGENFVSKINPKTGRIHPHYSQLSASSGRMSCYKPNLQQIPKSFGFRECIVPAPGKKFLIADYSQVELRVAAVVAKENRMLAAFRSGEDLHRLTASSLSRKLPDQITKEERQAAKAVNFGFLYGMGSERFKHYASEQYGVKISDEEAEKYRATFFNTYPGIRNWHRYEPDRANRDRVLRTLTGRKAIIPEGENWFSGVLNFPVQGSAADGMKAAMGLVYRELTQKKNMVRICGMIHDELLLEVEQDYCSDEGMAEAKKMVSSAMKQAMENILENKVPIEVDIKSAESWAEK